MARTPTTFDENYLASVLHYYLRHQRGFDPADPETARFHVDENGKVYATLDVGRMRWACTIFIEGKRTVIGWGDTEMDSVKMAQEHPKWSGHNYRYRITAEAFAKIASGDFDASSWGK